MNVIITLRFAKFSKPCILAIVFTIYFETVDAPYHTPDHTPIVHTHYNFLSQLLRLFSIVL